MGINWPRPGIGDVSSYLASAVPYLTSSIGVPGSGSEPIEIKFPAVTRFIVVTNTLAGSAPNVPLRFGFSSNGVKGVENNNYLVLNNSETCEAEYRVTSIFLRSDSTLVCTASIAAGITGIEVGNLYQNWSGSMGIG